MKPSDFNKLLNERLKKTKTVLGLKGNEYSFNNDRLHNFKVAARMLNTTVDNALWGMAMKHLVSIEDLIHGRLANTDENVNEKIGDMINYLILLEAILDEARPVIKEQPQEY